MEKWEVISGGKAELTEENGTFSISVPIPERDSIDTILKLTFAEPIVWEGCKGRENDVYGLADGLKERIEDTKKRIEYLTLKSDVSIRFLRCKSYQLLTVHFHPSAAARSVPCRLSGLPFSVRLRRGHPRRNDRLPLARARGSP